MGLRQRLTLQIAALMALCLVAAAWILVVTVSGAATRAEEAARQQAEAERAFAVTQERSRLAAEQLNLLSVAVERELLSRRALLESTAARLAGNRLTGAWLLARAGRPPGVAGVRFPPDPGGGELDRAVAASTWPDEHATWLALFNQAGQLVAQGGEVPPQGAVAPPEVQSAVRQALQSLPWAGVVALSNGESASPHWLRVEPVRAADGRLAGAAAAAVDLNRAGRWLEPLVAANRQRANLTLSWRGGQIVSVRGLPSTVPADAPPGPDPKVVTGGPRLEGTDLSAVISLEVDQPVLSAPIPFEQGDLLARALVALGIIALTGALLAPLISARSARRLEVLAQHARRISLGSLDLPPPGVDDPDEAGELARAVDRMRVSVTELQRRQPRRHRWR